MEAPKAQIFKFVNPRSAVPKSSVSLCRAENLVASVQVLKSGGENSLHSHKHFDGFWFVLSGRVRFYTTGDEVVGEAGQFEGVLIPKSFPYWFESVGDEELELLQVRGFDVPTTDPEASHRLDLTERRSRSTIEKEFAARSKA